MDYEESDEEGALEYKTEFCKMYFCTDDIKDNGDIYFLHDCEVADFEEVTEMG